MALPRIPTDLRGRELWLMLARDQVGRGILREVDALLRATFREVVQRLVTEYPDLKPREQQRLARAFAEVSTLIGDRYGAVSSTVTAHLEEFGGIEAAIARDEIALRLGTLGGLEAGFGSIARERVIAAADVLLEGRRMPEWWRLQAQQMTEATRRHVQTGLVLGESTRDIVKRILPPKESTDPAVYRRARQQAGVLVRTAVTGVSSAAHLNAYQRMDPRISDRYQLVAVRDARTSLICIANDGKVFRYDDPAGLVPPLHHNCRTTLRPVVDWKALGIPEPPNQGPGGWKDYESWLRAQPDETQRQILGASRWDMWRSGRISLRQLVDSDTRVLTIGQLNALSYPEGALSISGGRRSPSGIQPRDAVASIAPAKLTVDLVDPVLDAIGTIHAVPSTIARVPIAAYSSRRSLGKYDAGKNVVSLTVHGRHPSTLTHEFGHYLDSRAFGVADGTGGSYPESTMAHWMASHRPITGAWEEFHRAVRASAHFAHWSGPAGARDRQYMLAPAEVFARAYERWIFDRLPATHPVRRQWAPKVAEQVADHWLWSAEDFTDVARAMDSLFRELGWLR
jgi:SPP1 gp7 family putative phage head morphogenesis protein